MALVCSCYGVSDREIRAAVAGGASNVGAVGEACDAGTSCEGCVETIEAILDSAERLLDGAAA